MAAGDLCACGRLFDIIGEGQKLQKPGKVCLLDRVAW